MYACNTSIYSVTKFTPTSSHLAVHLKISLVPFPLLFLYLPLIFFFVIYIALVALSWLKPEQLFHTFSLVGGTDIIKIVGNSTTVLSDLTYEPVHVSHDRFLHRLRNGWSWILPIIISLCRGKCLIDFYANRFKKYLSILEILKFY